MDFNLNYGNWILLYFNCLKIYGNEFETVTLRSLGLGSGKALFRLLHRNLQSLKEQAHVYVPPQPKVSKMEDDEENRQRTNKNIFKSNNLDPISVVKTEKQQLQSNVSEEKKCENKGESNISSNKNEPKSVEQEPITHMEIDETKPSEEESKVAEKKVFEEPKVEFVSIYQLKQI